jgi:hypothetical protein
LAFFVFRETDYHFEYGGLDDIFDLIRRFYTCQCGGLGADRDKKSAAKKKSDRFVGRVKELSLLKSKLDLVYRRGRDSMLKRYHYWRLHPFTLDEYPKGISTSSRI